MALSVEIQSKLQRDLRKTHSDPMIDQLLKFARAVLFQLNCRNDTEIELLSQSVQALTNDIRIWNTRSRNKLGFQGVLKYNNVSDIGKNIPSAKGLGRR